MRLSTASTEETPSKWLSAVQPVASLVQYCQVKTASSADTTLPSDQLSPSFSFQVIEVRSCETPPFSMVGISAAKAGTRLPFGVYLARGSSVSAPASLSL